MTLSWILELSSTVSLELLFASGGTIGSSSLEMHGGLVANTLALNNPILELGGRRTLGTKLRKLQADVFVSPEAPLACSHDNDDSKVLLPNASMHSGTYALEKEPGARRIPI